VIEAISFEVCEANYKQCGMSQTSETHESHRYQGPCTCHSKVCPKCHQKWRLIAVAGRSFLEGELHVARAKGCALRHERS
jgi:hypothetical protein